MQNASVSTTAAVVWPQHHEAEIPAEVRGLIFDCDGTLIDTMPAHYHAWLRVLDKCGVPFPEEQFYGFAGMPTAKIVECLNRMHGVALCPETVAHEKEEVYLDCLPTVSAIHEVVAIARREKGRRKLAVASGGWERVVRQSLRTIGIEGLFETVVGADHVDHGKPAPDVFLEAARRMGLKPDECVVYEDGELGFQAAQAAGMRAIDVRPWYLPRKEGGK